MGFRRPRHAPPVHQFGQVITGNPRDSDGRPMRDLSTSRTSRQHDGIMVALSSISPPEMEPRSAISSGTAPSRSTIPSLQPPGWPRPLRSSPFIPASTSHPASPSSDLPVIPCHRSSGFLQQHPTSTGLPRTSFPAPGPQNKHRHSTSPAFLIRRKKVSIQKRPASIHRFSERRASHSGQKRPAFLPPPDKSGPLLSPLLHIEAARFSTPSGQKRPAFVPPAPYRRGPLLYPLRTKAARFCPPVRDRRGPRP